MANIEDGVPAPVERQEKLNRVRVGLTGLAVVLVLVFLATTIISRISENAVATPESNAAAQNSGNAAQAEDEPLADLGVAPGTSNDTAGAAAKP